MTRRLLLAGGVLAALSCADPTAPVQQDQLLFVSAVMDQSNPQAPKLMGDIHRMNADGSGDVNLTKLASTTYHAMDLSPDGKTVVFHSDRESCLRIWRMNTDGTALTNLTPGEFSAVRCNHNPHWSPDGTRILFNTSRNSTYSAYVMNADGSNPHNVSTGYDAAEGGGVWPESWTPDGRAVWVKLFNGATTYTVSADGANITPLFGRMTDRSPYWSPDGSKVAFIRVEGTAQSLWVANADGSNATRLTQTGNAELNRGGTTANAMRPWSADGKWIAFYDLSANTYAIEVINVDGSGRQRLTEHAEGAMFDGWSPDGRITFHAPINGLNDLFLINKDKTGRVNLTSTPDKDESLALWLRR